MSIINHCQSMVNVDYVRTRRPLPPVKEILGGFILGLALYINLIVAFILLFPAVNG